MKYRIEKGQQSSRPRRFGLYINKKGVAFKATFNLSAIYENEAAEDKEDWNKLLGIGYLPHHHTNSARFGWRYNSATGKVAIGAYWYSDKERFEQVLCEVEIGAENYYELIIGKDTYTWMISCPTQSMSKFVATNISHSIFGYPLNFTFGGNNYAPHDMDIDITILK